MRQLLHWIGVAARYLAYFVGQGALVLWRLLIDGTASARAMWLRRVARREPRRGQEIDERLGRLRAARSARWASFRALPWAARVGAGAAAVVIAAALVGSVQTWTEIRYGSSPASETVGRDSISAAGQVPDRPRGARPPGGRRDWRSSDDVAAAFTGDATHALPGMWVVAGGRSAAEVLTPGALGTWDDFKIDSPVVVKTRAGFGMWFRGCRFSGGEYACGVGFARSPDGVRWTAASAPVFAPGNPFDRAHLDAIAVAGGSAGYVLWYSVGASWSTGVHYATLHAARSKDGLTWRPAGTVYTAVAPARTLLPTAAWDGSEYHLWIVDSQSALDPATNRFPEMPADGDDVLLHYTSSDGAVLTAAGSTPIRPLRIEDGPISIQPSLTKGFRAVLYEPHSIGAAPQGVVVLRSVDGSDWQRGETIRFSLNGLGPRLTPASVTALDTNGGTLYWFVARRERGVEAITVAYRKDTGS